MMKKPEVLSPAGNFESFEYALAFGADAIYVGAKEFGMRSSSLNFTFEQLAQAVHMARQKGKRVFLTVNTMPSNEEISRLPDFLRSAANTGVDAFIIADLGVLALAKKYTPEMEIHFSTQAGITNYAAANMAWELGAKRVVLARELSLQEISFIRRNIPQDLELEVFVHGAMCMSVSGRCLISQYMAGRDANRGRCPQSCRWRYTLHEETRQGQSFEIGEGEGGSYLLSADDLCMAPFIDMVIEAGVDSLKIEGRGKSFYYVASVTAAYRAAVDAYDPYLQEYTCPDFVLEELRRTSHRPYSTGFFFGQEGATQSPGRKDYVREWQLIAVVTGQQDNLLQCSQRGKFSLGDTLEALTPDGKSIPFAPSVLLDQDKTEIESTPHPKMLFYINQPEGESFPPKTILRKKIAQ